MCSIDEMLIFHNPIFSIIFPNHCGFMLIYNVYINSFLGQHGLTIFTFPTFAVPIFFGVPIYWAKRTRFYFVCFMDFIGSKCFIVRILFGVPILDTRFCVCVRVMVRPSPLDSEPVRMETSLHRQYS